MQVEVTHDGLVRVACPRWAGLSIEALGPALEADGAAVALTRAARRNAPGRATAIEYEFGGRLKLEMLLTHSEAGAVRLTGRLRNIGQSPAVLNRLSLLASSGAVPVRLGDEAEAVAMLVQSVYRGDIVPLKQSPACQSREPNEPAPPADRRLVSEHVWVAYDRAARQALLVGFETTERFNGRISLSVRPDGTIGSWSVGFDGGDLLVAPGQEVAVEDLLLMHGPDPLRLLDHYGEAVFRRHKPRMPSSPPVSWCSWYPYRLSVTEDRILENARVAARRLRPLGLRIIEADLGWEKGNLPNAFETNDRFPHGLKWLSQELGKLGFDLGCWKAPFTVSEFHPLLREHPEWLIAGEDGQPAPVGTWHWVPHGKVFVLDVTHPGAQDWLRANIRSLRDRGVKYLKADFIGILSYPIAKRRHDPKIAAGGGTEAGRIAAEIIRQELGEAMILNCSGPEMPGTGQWPLLYTSMDTGNTGCLSWPFQRNNFRSVACHLFRNRRWGIIQPSCLCVGLPGSLVEARVRATMAFLSGGQIDISDTLTTLPEDRWAVLEATLPPLGISARPIDLFEPVHDPGTKDYAAVCKGEAAEALARPHPPGSVWHLRVQHSWDAWDLVAFFALDAQADKPTPVRFRLPLERLSLTGRAEDCWAYEFWSGQFLGRLPGGRRNPNDYEHPGDLQDLLVGRAADSLEIAFTPPAVKLLCLRPVRPHPWVVGTSFHQSCGAELDDVRWDGEAGVLSGRLSRPPGHAGFVMIEAAGQEVISADVDGSPTVLAPSANGAWRLPVTTGRNVTEWRVSFAPLAAGRDR